MYANNKGNAHNIFAIPVITPTFGILDWTKEELLAIDVKTRKILTTTGSFHLNSDVDRLYCNRTKGGRGLNSLVDIYISRILSVGQHLRECAMSNVFLADVLKHEQNNLIRIANELATCYGINTDQVESPKKLSADIRQKLKDDHLDKWKKKPQHGYLNRTRETVSNVNEKYTNAWLKKSSFSSHVEGYLCAIQEEELQTNAIKAKRSKDGASNPYCRLCKCSKETIQHIIACCPRLSASMYLPLRHNKVANIIYQNLVTKNSTSERQPIQDVYTDEDIEIWWDTKINTLRKCEHNKPDIVLWKKKDKMCYVIDVRVGLDVNIDKNIKEKLDNYLQLTAELKRLYGDFTFEVIPVILGATGLMSSHMCEMLKVIGITNVDEVMSKCQKSALLGTLKIVKSFMKM